MKKTNKYNNPSDLGPWNPIFDSKEPDEEDQQKINQTIQEKTETQEPHHFHLPKIEHYGKINQKEGIKSHRLTIRMSQHSLQLKANSQMITDKSRYNCMNGSRVQFFKSNGIGKHSLNLEFTRQVNQFTHRQFETINSHNLSRKMSTVKIGEPIQHSDNISINKVRKASNAQSCKKRSLFNFIRKTQMDEDLMNLYYLSKRKII